jgi:hypothetical protein
MEEEEDRTVNPRPRNGEQHRKTEKVRGILQKLCGINCGYCSKWEHRAARETVTQETIYIYIYIYIYICGY